MGIKENITSNISKYRKDKGISQKELAEMIGAKNLTTVSSWERGVSSPDIETLFNLCDIFGITINEMYGVDSITTKDECSLGEKELVKKYQLLDEHGKKVIDTVIDIELQRIEGNKILEFKKNNCTGRKERTDIAKLNLSEQKASAGTGVFLSDENMIEIDVEFNYLTARADFAVPVDGNSMLPNYKNNDILLVHKQPAIDVGEIGIFTINDLGYVKQQGEDRLISLNAEYDDIYPNEDDFIKCCGKVIGILEPDWIIEK